MTRYPLAVIPHASLFVGGYAQARGESDGSSAGDGAGLLLPGSTVKGALREAAERLVRGAGLEVGLVGELFGDQDKEGILRVGLFRAEMGTAAGAHLPELALRHHVSLERSSRQAAHQRLFQQQVTPAGCGLVFRGVLEASGPLTSDQLGLLQAVVEITDQIGGGRGRGLGRVRVELAGPGDAEAEPPAAPEPPPSARSITLVLEAREPLQLAGLEKRGNYTTTKTSLDGSVVRGAVAAALTTIEPVALDLVLGGAAPVVFGDAHPGGPGAIPAPLTLDEPKGGGALCDQALQLAAEACGVVAASAQDLRRVKGTVEPCSGRWCKVPVAVRTITHTARDHSSGRAADGLLYSLEVIDPFLPRDGADTPEPLRFHAPVEGSGEQLSWVLAAASPGLLAGADRSRGLGRLALAGVLPAAPLAPVAERHRRWAEALGQWGVGDAQSTGALLALGPLALDPGRLAEELGSRGLELLHGVARRQLHGGWNRAEALPRTVTSQYVPGSVFLVRATKGGSAAPALAALEQVGLGPGRADGWGRLVACHPIHLNCAHTDRSQEAPA
jgi:hypothetical protein